MIRIRGNADKNSDVRALGPRKSLFQAVFGISSVFDGGPNRFQEETFLGINDLGFFGGNIKEAWVELVVIVEEAAPFAVDLSVRGSRWIRMIELFIVPAAGRHQIDQVSAVLQIFPIFVQVSGVRKMPVNTNDRNGQ